MNPTKAFSPACLFYSLAAFGGWATTDALGRYAMLHMGISQQNSIWIITLFALVPVMALITLKKEWQRLKPRHPWLLLLRSAITVAEMWLIFMALKQLPLAVCFAGFFTTPVWTALISRIFLKENSALHNGRPYWPLLQEP